MSGAGETAARVRALLSQVLDVPPERIGADFSQDTATSWSSLNHLMLVSQLESEFGVTFSNKEIRDLTSLERIVATLARRQVE